jgi:pimeloyl-ACP methyl ester carboxylesterase
MSVAFAQGRGAILASVLDRRRQQAHDDEGGRHVLIWDDVGDSGGVPVLYFHGGGDSRLTRHPDDAIARSAGIRLIAVERCGIVDPRRTLLGFARDVEAVADELGLPRFSVLGWSAGGPHALAVAAALPSRVANVSVVGGMPTPSGLRAMPRDVRATIRLARISPRLAVAPLTRWSRQPVPSTGSPECDRAYTDGRVEAFRGGATWLAVELAMLARPWGFDLAQVRAPVTLWYGSRDVVCPPSIGEAFARELPNATLRIVADTHQLLFSQWPAILQDLAARDPSARAERSL